MTSFTMRAWWWPSRNHDQETLLSLQDIVKQFEMSYNLIMSNEEEGKGAGGVAAKEDLIMETLNVLLKIKN